MTRKLTKHHTLRALALTYHANCDTWSIDYEIEDSATLQNKKGNYCFDRGSQNETSNPKGVFNILFKKLKQKLNEGKPI